MNNIDVIQQFIQEPRPLGLHLMRPKGFLEGANEPATITAEEQTITNFLSRLILLDGVPLHYIIPHPNLLPDESIRFFTIDMEWLNHLIKGALTLGSNTDWASAIDKAVEQAFKVQGENAALQHIRENVLEHLHHHLPDTEQKLLAESVDKFDNALSAYHQDALSAQSLDASNTDFIYTKKMFGFVMRSEFVRKYPGVKVKAYDGETEVPILNSIVIDNHIKLCLFGGQCDMIRFFENTGALSLGFDLDGAELIKKIRAKPADANIALQGQLAPDELPFKGDKENRVLDITALREAIKGKTRDQAFDSAHFAYYMLQGAENVQFKINKQS